LCAVRGAAGGGAAADEALLQRLRNFHQHLVHDLLGRARVIDLVEGESLVASAQHLLRLAPDLFQAALARLKDKVAGQFAFTKAGNGRYILTKKDDLVFVYDTRVGQMTVLTVSTNSFEFKLPSPPSETVRPS
jgi:hypothetical protein